MSLSFDRPVLSRESLVSNAGFAPSYLNEPGNALPSYLVEQPTPQHVATPSLEEKILANLLKPRTRTSFDERTTDLWDVGFALGNSDNENT